MKNKHLKDRARKMKLMSHPTAIDILDYITKHPKTSVTPIYKNLDIEQSVCSTFLGKLRKAAFIDPTRDGKKIRYEVKHDEIDKCLSYVSEHFYAT